MNIREYLNESKLSQAAFGRMLSPPVSQGKVNHWLHGTRRVSLVEAIQIQLVTKNQVTIFDMAMCSPHAETLAPPMAEGQGA